MTSIDLGAHGFVRVSPNNMPIGEIPNMIVALSKCVEREDRIDGEWGSGKATYSSLRQEIEDELSMRLKDYLDRDDL